MFFLDYGRVLISLVVLFQVETLDLKAFEATCDKLTKPPYFKNEMVLGRKWTAYVSWEIGLREICMEVRFQRANSLITKSVENNMRKYLTAQPNWDDATMYMSISPGYSRRLLLIDRQIPVPGRFLQIDHLLRGKAHRRPAGKEINITRLVMKVLQGGRYLVISDCGMGVTLLLIPQDSKPNWDELKRIAGSLDIGYGIPTCVNPKGRKKTPPPRRTIFI